MSLANIIIKPLVTEKSSHQSATRNTYSFEVVDSASKPDIKSAIEMLYSVKVKDVRTLTRKGKPKRTKTKMIKKGGYKRAIVTLAEESKIELF